MRSRPVQVAHKQNNAFPRFDDDDDDEFVYPTSIPGGAVKRPHIFILEFSLYTGADRRTIVHNLMKSDGYRSLGTNLSLMQCEFIVMIAGSTVRSMLDLYRSCG